MAAPGLREDFVKEEQQKFMALWGQLPARLTVEQAAWVLNCQPHDVPVLIAAKLLKPLGNPPANGIKFFATVDVLELVKDRSWLARMTNTVCQHWQKKNAVCKRRISGKLTIAVATDRPALSAA